MMKAYVGVEVALFSFLILALDEMTGQLYAHASPHHSLPQLPSQPPPPPQPATALSTQ